MACHQSLSARDRMRLAPILVALVTAWLPFASGCDWWQLRSDDPKAKQPAAPAAPAGPAAAPAASVIRVDTIWENHVVTTEDSVNKGSPLLGIAGRLYLFGPMNATGPNKGCPLNVPGAVDVELYEMQAGKEPILREKWHIGKDKLKILGSNDLIGWGYTLFLPWSTFRPDVAHVQLRATFTPDSGQPIYAPTSTVSLHNEGVVPITQSRMPAGQAPNLQPTGFRK